MSKRKKRQPLEVARRGWNAWRLKTLEQRKLLVDEQFAQAEFQRRRLTKGKKAWQQFNKSTSELEQLQELAEQWYAVEQAGQAIKMWLELAAQSKQRSTKIAANAKRRAATLAADAEQVQLQQCENFQYQSVREEAIRYTRWVRHCSIVQHMHPQRTFASFFLYIECSLTCYFM